MTDALTHQIKVACDDLYCAPLDPVAQTNVRHVLLQATPPLDERAHARRIKIACDELHDDPTDLDARRTLLALLDLSAAASRPDLPTRI
ncbi:hypothetical protein [Mycolicibacterium frederiksbergense]|uniref:Uncharacterized protein n=1 Tax=Mycolicibacterium frederiksbergense TaxID=117567 RepID=A0A6H0RWH8_9MYCO|nr:hypothetical protein [Mycolicibacterium frederiksbergense]QIV79622.1 hypothetical protein EXE63_00840 [Mycolicibacterium frederiksbergense]